MHGRCTQRIDAGRQRELDPFWTPSPLPYTPTPGNPVAPDWYTSYLALGTLLVDWYFRFICYLYVLHVSLVKEGVLSAGNGHKLDIQRDLGVKD